MERKEVPSFETSVQAVHEDTGKTHRITAIGGCGGLDFGVKLEENDECEIIEKRTQAKPPATSSSPTTTKKKKKKTRGRVKIKMEFIENKLRRYTTFSKRKTGIMKKVSGVATDCLSCKPTRNTLMTFLFLDLLSRPMS